jgi:uncharacterized membrane protein
MSLDLVVIVFGRIEDAELAYADARERAPDAPWINEVAFVEHHWHDRIVMRGTFAGRYVYVDDLGDATGPDAVVGALTGALVGSIFGPAGFATGLVGGASIGGYIDSVYTKDPQGDLFEEVRRDIPEGSSAVLLLAAPEHADAMIDAFDNLGGTVIRRTLTDEQVERLTAAVQDAPRV